MHEQLHWHLRDHDKKQRRGQQPNGWPARAGRLPEGRDPSAPTPIIDCYLEIQADRQLIGPERTDAVIRDKGHYTWIYETVLRDEPRIAALVARHALAVR